MSAKFRSALLRGIEALTIEIQIASEAGEGFEIIGLQRREVNEGASRLFHAFRASGFSWPESSITINLAPADIPKLGTALDLAIALTILEKSGQIKNRLEGHIFAIGELNLDGTLRRSRGALSVAQMVPDGSVLLAPIGNRYELGLLHQVPQEARKDFTPYMVKDLGEAVRVVQGEYQPLPRIQRKELTPAFHEGVNFKEVKGQARAKRALEVAAAGGHNVLLIGPPGEGKSLLAKALPSILPRLGPREVVELTKIYSAKGELELENSVVLHRPFRAIHHSASREAIIGGGSPFPMPGELTMAHRGVLFMDEIPEFSGSTLNSLRQPLEDGVIRIARTEGAPTYPCEIILVGAMNPCPCGFEGEYICEVCRTKIPFGETTCAGCQSTRQNHSHRCRCKASHISSYKDRISGPVMDRIDLTIRVGSLTPEEKFGTFEKEDSSSIRKRVEAAREIQKRRFAGTGILVNARIPGGQVDKYCELQPSALAAMKEVAKRIPELTTRGHDKLLKVARTVADLNNSTLITRKHIVEGANLCGHDRVKEFLEREDSECPSCGHKVEAGDKFCRHCGKATY